MRTVASWRRLAPDSMIAFVFSAWEKTSGSSSASARSSAVSIRSLATSTSPGEELEASELRSERGQCFVRLVLGEHLERTLQARDGVRELPTLPHELGPPGRHACGPMDRVRALEPLDRVLEVAERILGASTGRRLDPRALVQLCPADAVVGELDRTLVGPLGLGIGAERGGALGSTDRACPRAVPSISLSVLGLGRRAPRVEVVRSDDLDDLVLL